MKKDIDDKAQAFCKDITQAYKIYASTSG